MNKKELLELIRTGEGYTLEFKERINNLGKEICAFANASGGKIILGVRDNGEIVGFKLTNSNKSRINDITRNMDPSFQVNIEQVSDLVVIYVPEGKEKPYFVNGHCYLRQSANSQQLTRDEIRSFFQKENLVRFDRKANLDFGFENDFDNMKLKHFLIKAKINDLLPTMHILENLNLLTDGKMNNAGVLFFAHRISKFFYNAIIGCVLYEGTKRVNILDKAEFDADFISNLNNAILFALRNLRVKYIIKKLEREEKPEIPEEVLRELILNAMVHRDYFSEGRVLIEIFHDRVEISNPGGLLFDKKYFGKKSLARNPILVDLVHRLGLVEKVGSGVNRVKEILKENVNFEIEDDEWFRVVIKRKTKGLKEVPKELRDLLKEVSVEWSEKWSDKWSEKWSELTKREQQILVLIIDNPKISRAKISERLGINPSAVQKHLQKLKDKKIIKRVGPDKGGRWEVME